MIAVGDTIDRFVVEAELGHGAAATVYLVRHKQLGSQFALKVLNIYAPAVRERLLREGRIQANIRHAHVARVIDVLEFDGATGLVLEYIDGPDLGAWLREQTRGLEPLLWVFRDIVDGVGHVHGLGHVHRDLKPTNILIARHDGEVVPKVTDFGVARALAAEGDSARLTTGGLIMGTPAYSAPEQIRNLPGADQRADLFSLGCILYEMVCGELAFPQPQPFEAYKAICAGDYLPPRKHRPDLPTPVVHLIERLLKVDPEERIPDCQRLVAEIDRILDGDGAGAGPASHPVRDPPRRGGSRLVMALGCGVVLLGLTGLAGLAALRFAVRGGDGPAEVSGPQLNVEEPPAPDEPSPEGPAASPEAPAATPPSPAGTTARPGAEATARSAPTTGRVQLTGDASAVYLVSGSRSFKSSEAIPEGSYQLQAFFDGPDPVLAGTVTVRGGSTVTLHCSSEDQTCAP